MESVERILLFDYYGDLLTSRQKLCFDMHYNQDLSLGEIAQELSISRQAVYDNLSRTEALLKNMEEKTGCVSRDRQLRKSMERIAAAAETLITHPDSRVSKVAEEILSQAKGFEE
ncbi:MAG: DNA-binding protein [Ruminococcaceae bacterium]|nr:DNA-binding protein [Oscillospiraceae bacterium]